MFIFHNHVYPVIRSGL